MSTPFQNRLVGTIIVAAVIIIFLPDVLDGVKKSHQTDFEAIPKASTFSGKLTDKPFPEDRLTHKKAPVISEELAIDDEYVKSTEESVKQKTIEPEKKVVAAKAKPKAVVVAKKEKRKLPEKAVAHEAWVIHLGSFKNKDNVKQLVNKLKANGYIVFTKPIKTKQGMLTKVIIGPELIKSTMDKKLPALKSLTGIQGKVAYFEVNK